MADMEMRCERCGAVVDGANARYDEESGEVRCGLCVLEDESCGCGADAPGADTPGADTPGTSAPGATAPEDGK